MNLSFRLLRAGDAIGRTRRSHLTNFLFGFVAIALGVFVFGTSNASGQASSSLAELRGQVTDSTGAVIPNATVTLTDTARGTTRTAQTDENDPRQFGAHSDVRIDEMQYFSLTHGPKCAAAFTFFNSARGQYGPL